MQYRLLGHTGVRVSALCYGTMSFGGDADEATSAAMYARCRDVGVNFFDTANTYGRGRSEEILGRLMAGHRDELIITSKVGFRMREGANGEGLSRRNIMREVEDSLRRLQTDRIDIYFAHRFDPDTPVEETLAAFDTLVQQGKILYPAVSNWPAWQIARALGISERKGWAPFACLQPMYNLAKRQVEVEILPLAQAEQLGVIPYSPLGGGLLTGKYGVQQRPTGGRIVENALYGKRYGDGVYYEIAERFAEYARSHGYQPATLAVAWVMAHPAVTAPIIGARNLEQLEASLAAADLLLPAEQRAEISALSIEPPVATDRSEER
jgi:aryl-alcohol dehydrogenase-like predicted oxidoreductase